MAGDLTIEILTDIRDEIRSTNQRIDTTNQRLDTVETTLTHRLGALESALLDLAEQQRFVVRYTKAIAERDTRRIEGRVSALETRVDKLESK
jgi:flagellar capping protein FliD